MSLKQEIETWVAALAAYDNNEFDEALRLFDNIADTSKILFNCGVIHATLGEHEKAVESYQRATRLDQYLAVAYFQQGVSNFLMGDFEEALANFNDTLLYLRGNNSIDYEQLGLKFKLYSCEALFNRGLCYIYLQQKEPGMQDLMYAAREKVVPDHDVIDEAIREEAEGYTVFSIPVGIVYRPNEAKVKNLKTKDYLGKARLVAATDRANAFTGFTGAELKKLNEIANVKDDRPEEKISYAATNLVKPGLTSRSRQQSEPPITRNVFPPTPPPENDTRRPPSPGGYSTRSQSVVSRKPAPLDLGRAAFEQPKPRVMPSRSASERPAPSRQMSTSSRSTEEPYADDLYDMYDRSYNSMNYTSSSTRSRNRPQKPMYIEEEEEENPYSPDSVYDVDFEMVPTRGNVRQPSNAMPPASMSRRSVPTIKTIRVKVHADDTRYVFIDPNVRFDTFSAQIRDKFALRQNFKIKIRDDNDMITMSDQEDLQMAISNCSAEAKRERKEMGKMEVWVQQIM
ncbi:NADPH oxidase-like protein regulator NoxR [Phyllosticta citricarpa]|uniref:NADPH oxidase-like protein regulator NoxR n=1 Tax=Phyllosticta citricarpa TaxID=55181 RepID=A0ABR1MNK0_9PEZI